VRTGAKKREGLKTLPYKSVGFAFIIFDCEIMVHGHDFQAAILAGGLGTRMRPLTESIPKPMLPVRGKPFLHHQLELLRSFGIRRVVLLVAYLGEQIEKHFGDGAALGLHLTYSHEPAPLGTGGALKNAEALLDEEFLLLNGDTYLAIDYAALGNAFRASKAMAMIVAYENSDARVPSNLALSLDRSVAAYRKRDPRGLTHVDAGVIALRREVLNEIPAGRACSLEEEIFPRLIERGQMKAWVTKEPFYDMGSPAGLEALAARLG
jgi:NDP-sugar pyrophosphorylase family protein